MSRSKRNKTFGGKITTPQPSWLSLDEADTSPPNESLVKLADIHLPPQQPRHYFDPQALNKLADSIKQHGILQPLLVRPLSSGGYSLVAGERRYRAATEAGLTEVPVVVKDLTTEAAWQLSLIENLHREDLNPVEETEGILQLLARSLSLPVSEVTLTLYRLQKAQKNKANRTASDVMGQKKRDSPRASHNVMGKSEGEPNDPAHNVMGKSEGEPNDPAHNVMGKREETSRDAANPDLAVIESVFTSLGLMTWESFVKNRLPLLNLPEDITEALRAGKIAYTKAKAIAIVKDELERAALLKETIDNQLSLSQIKEKIKALQPQSDSETTEIPERLKVAYQKVKKTRIWEDNKKRRQIENLLTKLEALINEE